MSDTDYKQLSESIKLIFDLTSRIDERVKILVEQQNSTNSKVEKLVDKDQSIMSRLAILESKGNNGLKTQLDSLQQEVSALKDSQKVLEKDKDLINLDMATIKIHTQQSVSRWQWMGDAAFKIFIATMAAILAWKLGISM